MSVFFFAFCRNHITKPKPSAAGLAWRGKRKEHNGTFARRVKEERCEFLLTRGSSSKSLENIEFSRLFSFFFEIVMTSSLSVKILGRDEVFYMQKKIAMIEENIENKLGRYYTCV